MQQAQLRKRLLELGLLSALAVLGTFAVLDAAKSEGSHRSAGVMPEVVSVAERPRLQTNEVIVRATRPVNAGAVAQLSGINK